MSIGLSAVMSEAALKATYSHNIAGKKYYSIDTGALRREFLRRWIIFNDDIHLYSCPQSGSIFFLFYKNSSVTNIQYSELVSLIRVNSNMRGSRQNLIFSSTSEYENFLSNVWESYFGDLTTRRIQLLHEAARQAATFIAKDYGTVIRSTVSRFDREIVMGKASTGRWSSSRRDFGRAQPQILLLASLEDNMRAIRKAVASIGKEKARGTRHYKKRKR
jgi:hypothetical protein